MAIRLSYRLAAAACLGLTSAAGAADLFAVKPAAVAAHPDQQLADTIAGKLAQSGDLNGYHVEVTCQNGAVELTDSVRDQNQRNEVSKVVAGIRGVKKIDNKLALRGTIQKTQAAELVPGPTGSGDVGPNISNFAPGPMMGGDAPAAMPASMQSGSAQMLPGPGHLGGEFGGGYGGYGGGGTDPTPIGMPPTGGLYDSLPPKMPPYAWPTYAPYNNYSRVGYPTEYPQQAFPFIGPFYPFPKVPLGYRAIKLEWEDGHWYYGRTASKRDYWKVRYW